MFDNTSQSRDNTPYIPITTVLTKSSTKVPAIEQFDFTTFHLMISYANPSISLVCLILNITSVTVFIKSGLRKPANVFLCTLSISDIMSNGLTLNFARALRYFDAAKKYPGIFAWEYHYEFSYMMYLCERLSDFFGYWGMYVQRTVPVILTIDRILAVYWPLHFRRWITFKSSCFISAGVFFLWLPWMLFSQSIFEFWYIEVKNLHFGSKVESPVFLNNETIIFIFNAYIIEILSSWIPATLVIAGCIAVGVKVCSFDIHDKVIHKMYYSAD
ncbi:hypothetical protein Btru_032680 [Bulinus truncatus]|nr:hypothetical protein Btru_032680 [Bulinus truncatus]